MTSIIDTIAAASAYAASVRPRVGGFPYLAEALRAAGVLRYEVDTAACTCTYLGAHGERYVEEYPAVALPDPDEAPIDSVAFRGWRRDEFARGLG